MSTKKKTLRPLVTRKQGQKEDAATGIKNNIPKQPASGSAAKEDEAVALATAKAKASRVAFDELCRKYGIDNRTAMLKGLWGHSEAEFKRDVARIKGHESADKGTKKMKPEVPSLSKEEIKERFGIEAPLGGNFQPHVTNKKRVLEDVGRLEVWSKGTFGTIKKEWVSVGLDEQGNPLPTPAVKPDAKFFDTYLNTRGIDSAFARDHGAHFDGPTSMHRGGYRPALPAIVFNNEDQFKGGRLASPARFQEPPKGKDGKPIKFTTPKGSIANPYLVDCQPGWKEIGNKAKVRIVISEGPTRAMSGAQRSIPVIALHGIDGAFEPGTNRGKLRAYPFDRIKWKGRKVYISFDCEIAVNNPAIQKLAELLTALGSLVYFVPALRITPDGKSGLDDEFAAIGTAAYLARCEAAPLWAATEHTGVEPKTRVLDDIEEKTIEYIWDGRIARGSLTLFSGDPGSAKSFLAITLAADFSAGRNPVTGEKRKPLRTLYATTENSPEQVIKPRFRAAGGNGRNCFILDGAEDESGVERAITLGDVTPLDIAIAKHKIDLLVLDPLQSYFGADADSHVATETRPRMDALIKLAVKHNIAILIIRHMAKAPGGRSIHRGLGSIDITAAARIELMVGNIANQPNNRAIITIKNNLGIFAPALDFSLEDGKGMDARLLWKGVSAKSLADLQGAEKSTTGIVRAHAFLKQQLETGPKTRVELMEASGGDFSMKMLERARLTLGVVDSRRGARGPATWSLRKTVVN